MQNFEYYQVHTLKCSETTLIIEAMIKENISIHDYM